MREIRDAEQKRSLKQKDKDSVRMTMDQALHENLVKDKKSDSNQALVDRLNHILANEFTLFTKTLNYHWNVTGPRFHSLHEFFEAQYRELLELMDTMAERIRILDESPVSTLREMRSDNTIIETPGKFLSADKMINDLLAGHMEIQRQIQDTLDSGNVDSGTDDFLVATLKAHQKNSWMLKSHLT
ncbi:MAG TPA: DNA starvation/stationary phase protection protein [Bdellovibrionales bacterium]|nr:DNA starvation/stationary phase protection protein [Bdellovibrionales bacterium]|tara:strand:+ start:2532 stop:3086 length:555 start_codon:yes stop_codon:yes gene_type:complete